MIVNRSVPSGTINPSLIYSDVGPAIGWLCDISASENAAGRLIGIENRQSAGNRRTTS